MGKRNLLHSPRENAISGNGALQVLSSQLAGTPLTGDTPGTEKAPEPELQVGESIAID